MESIPIYLLKCHKTKAIKRVLYCFVDQWQTVEFRNELN